MGFSVNSTDFDRRFKAIVEKAIPEEAAKGMFKAENALLHDAIYERPYAPFDEGHLRGSARAEEAKVEKDKITGLAGFIIVYAARWHELSPEEDARINWTLPGSGRKYLEIKLMKNKDKYVFIMAEHIRNSAK